MNLHQFCKIFEINSNKKELQDIEDVAENYPIHVISPDLQILSVGVISYDIRS